MSILHNLGPCIELQCKSPKDVQKTTLNVNNRYFEFIRMPFRLKNAPSTFQRVSDNILLGMKNERCLVYSKSTFQEMTIPKFTSQLTR